MREGRVILETGGVGYSVCMETQTLSAPTRQPRFLRASFASRDDDVVIVRQLARYRFLR
jgi:hypothetical protein